MKKNRTIQNIFVLCFLLISSQLIGQNNINYENINQEWSLIANQDGVNIFVMQTECNLDERFKPSTWLFYKLENTTNQSKTIEFTPAYTYDEGCVNCDDNKEYSLKFTVNANETIAGNCSFMNRNLTYCVHNPNLSGGWTLKNINLNQLKVK